MIGKAHRHVGTLAPAALGLAGGGPQRVLECGGPGATAAPAGHGAWRDSVQETDRFGAGIRGTGGNPKTGPPPA